MLLEMGVGLKTYVYVCSAEQEGIKADPTEMCELVSFVKRNKLQTEIFVIGQNQCELLLLTNENISCVTLSSGRVLFLTCHLNCMPLRGSSKVQKLGAVCLVEMCRDSDGYLHSCSSLAPDMEKQMQYT